MKWTDEQLTKIIDFIKQGYTYKQISNITLIPANAIRVKLGRTNNGYLKYNPNIIKKCAHCNNDIINYGIKFCSKSCSAKFNNPLKPKKEKIIKKRIRLNRKPKYEIVCLNCNKLVKTNGRKYCSNICFYEYISNEKIRLLETNDDKIISKHFIKRYLIKIYGEKCMDCGWCEINKTSGKIPIELEHINGDSNNNKLENLKLLCPNCHSLTPTYKALNKGNGRFNRMERYKNGKSY